jgi:hypothetical protein
MKPFIEMSITDLHWPQVQCLTRSMTERVSTHPMSSEFAGQPLNVVFKLKQINDTNYV